jgi:hypothetical protein
MTAGKNGPEEAIDAKSDQEHPDDEHKVTEEQAKKNREDDPPA